MMVDTTVYGYVGDGAVFCPDCAPEDEREGMGRVYSTDDTNLEGLSCNGCDRYIFKPDYEGLWEDAIAYIIATGHTKDDTDWASARAILRMFRDADFEVEGHFPDR